MHVNKIYSIEQIDQKVVKRVVEGLEEQGEEFAVLIAPDHPTPISTMTHCGEPVPYLLYRSGKNLANGADRYDEFSAKQTGEFVQDGHLLIKKLFSL